MKNQDALETAVTNLLKLVTSWGNWIDEIEKKKDLKALCVSLQSLTEQYDQIDHLRKQLAELYDRLNEGIIPQAFEDQGIDKIAIPELARSYYPLTKYSASLVNNDEAFKWLRKNKLGALITETVNRQTLAATLKGRLLEEGLDPPDSMKLDKYTIIGSSKYTPKGK